MNKRLALLAAKPAGTLLIHEIYRSLQGESTRAGRPCTFVRLAVCDSRCVWCDTPHAFHEGERMTPADVLARVDALGSPLVLITGGEPLLQAEVLPLMRDLCDRGYETMLETSGAHDVAPVDARVRVVMDIKCPDSGESERNRWENLDVLRDSAEIKFVISSRGDFDFACGVIRERALEGRFTLLFSPAWERVALADLSQWILDARLDARLQLQLHKLIWGGETRGV